MKSPPGLEARLDCTQRHCCTCYRELQREEDDRRVGPGETSGRIDHLMAAALSKPRRVICNFNAPQRPNRVKLTELKECCAPWCLLCHDGTRVQTRHIDPHYFPPFAFPSRVS